MDLQKTIKRILMEELSSKFRRRVPPDEMEKEFLESFEFAFTLLKRIYLTDIFLNELIDKTISIMLDAFHWRFFNEKNNDPDPVSSHLYGVWYDELYSELENHYRDRIIQMYNSRKEINESVLMEDKKMSPYFRRRIDLKKFEEQLNKGKVYVYYDSNSLKDYKWKLITATLENYIYYKYDTEIDRTNNETYETIDYLVDIFNDELTDMYETENRKRRPDY